MAKAALVFIYGDENFLIEEKLHDFQHQFDGWEQAFYQGTFLLADVIQDSLMTSLFSPHKLVLFKDPWFLYQDISESDLKRFNSLCQSIEDGGHRLVIYSTERKPDMRRRFNIYLKTHFSSFEFSAFKEWEQSKVIDWMSNRIRKLGKSIDQDALVALQEANGTDLRQLNQEIDKLDIYTGQIKRISLQAVQLMAFGNFVSTFDLIEALKRHDIKRVLAIWHQLILDGEEPIRLLGLIHSTFRLFYHICYFHQQRWSCAEIAKRLDKKPFYIEKLLPFVQKHYSLQRLEAIFVLLGQADFAIKTGRMQPESALLFAFSSL